MRQATLGSCTAGPPALPILASDECDLHPQAVDEDLRAAPSGMHQVGREMRLLLDALGGVLRFVLRLFGFALALAIVATLFLFFMLALLVRLIFGGKSRLKVSAHFENMRNFRAMSQTVMRRGGGPRREGPLADEPGLLSRHGPGSVEDVQARELPPHKR